jgi:hypothetical protein
MTEPTDNKVLVKARLLARDDGRPWLWSQKDSDLEQDGRCRMVVDALRVQYLNRALELLRNEKRNLSTQAERPQRGCQIASKRDPLSRPIPTLGA